MIYMSKSKRDGWQATSTYQLPDGEHELKISTYKPHAGGLLTLASVAKKDGGFRVHIMFEDYSAHLEHSRTRCTENTVAAQHLRHTTDVGPLLAKVTAIYEGKAAAKAAKAAATETATI